MYIAIFLLAIVVVIMIHEFGHFATAKLFGMRAERFFLGFGPTLWSVQKGETEYGVKAVPAGGFVKITGMSSHEEVDPADEPRAFYTKPAWQRAVVLAAGSATHFVLAVALLWSALALVGLPTQEATNEVAVVTDDSPAAAAGLEPGDVIVAVAGVEVPDFEAVRAEVAARGGQDVTLTVRRDGDELELAATLATVEGEDGAEVGFLGVMPEADVEVHPVPPGEALSMTLAGDFSVVRLTQLTVLGLGQAFSPEGLSNWLGQLTTDGPRSPEGPVSLVGAGQIAGELGRQGDMFGFLVILVQLNLVLGILNLLPLPPLDGGHLAVLAVEEGVNKVRRVRGTPGRWTIDPSRLVPVALAVILFFGAIMITAVVIDIMRPASEILR
jgi:membrane-associated protease RseP (regulator of RpoE activity)